MQRSFSSLGQALRLRLSPQTFRRWFLIGLALLGSYLGIMTLA